MENEKAVCPKCKEGEHGNCNGEAIDWRDRLVDCECEDVQCR